MSAVIPPPDLIRDLDRGFRQWHIKEIYTPGGSGRYVPNVDDLVLDYENGWMRVISVDYTTGISIRIAWTAPTAGGIDDGDVIVGSGPGYTSESFRMFLNTSVVPFSLTCDSRILIKGSASSYCKVFRGTDISATTGKVVSAFYDQSGEFLGENIPLELVSTTDFNNISQKTPKVGYTAYRMDDGEVVTLVTYSSEGHVTDVARMVIMNSSFVRSTADSMKYVRCIDLESSFLSPSDPNTLMFPINAPTLNVNLMGVVTYSNGETRRMPVDGTRFTMDGLNEYIATVEGQRMPLVLHYQLAENEYSYVSNPTFDDKISKMYWAQTTAFNGSVGVKLFCVPVWQNVLTGYRLEWYLYNLVRAQWYEVTNLVQPATGSAVFDPIRYGISQHISVAVNLKQVDSRFADWRHVQNITIQLKAPGNEPDSESWAVIYTPGQDPVAGLGVKALAHLVNVNNWEVDITCGCTTLSEWLDKVYYPQQPLLDDRTEEVPPEPNYLLIRSATYEVEVPIAQWNSVMTMTNVPAQGGAIYVHFMRRNASTDLQLGMIGMITHRS